MSDKIPPHNLEAEEAVLGCILIDPDSLVKISDFLKPEDFYKKANSIIYEVVLDLFSRNQPIDILSLSNRLSEKKKLRAVGGRKYIANLANSVPSASNIESYAEIVHKKATLRRLIDSATKIIGLAYEDSEDVEATLDNAEQLLFKVSQSHLKKNFIPMSSIISEAFERIDEIHKEKGRLRGIGTGFVDLDNILGGLQKSDLIILAARPSMGKTSLALDIARNVAKQNIAVGLFSLEMGKEQLVDRMLCAEAGVDLWKMRTGKLSEENDFPRIGLAMGVLSEIPIFIDDSAGCNVLEIRTKARRLQMEKGLGLIIIDYLQLMEGRKSTDNRVQEVSQISRMLKLVARELDVPVIALSQLSRAVEMNNPPIPKLSHLRESGSIEQDADVVMFVYREEYYNKDTDRKNIADIIIAKHRNGPTGQVQLFFDQAKASFRNLEKHYNDIEI